MYIGSCARLARASGLGLLVLKGALAHACIRLRIWIYECTRIYIIHIYICIYIDIHIYIYIYRYV